MKPSLLCLAIFLAHCCRAPAAEPDTLPDIGDHAPRNLEQMWAGFDPRSEPLEVEVLKDWEEDDVVLRVVRLRIGVFKGEKALLAGIYGFPRSSAARGEKLPGLLQIHGGGQYADAKACLTNAKRGYATLSIAWAGRISSSRYRVSPREVQLFWENKTEEPGYRQTTDWGLVDGYHAPSRNPGNQFPSALPHPWTLDRVESPRNSGWFLCALAARRALTFLEQQPEVDPDRLGVYGHSMGGKLTVMTAVDPRVKAAAPSCGGISDRTNRSPLFRATLGDEVSLRQIRCPLIFLSPANDFHGRLGDLNDAVKELASQDWRVTCSPHHNHQDTPPYEVATQLWFDQHLKHRFQFPETPATALTLNPEDGIPRLTVRPDDSRSIVSVDVFYSQQGTPNETPRDRETTIHRFWHHAPTRKSADGYQAKLPLATSEKPLWVFANVTYSLDPAITAAGYYYGIYAAETFNLSSVVTEIAPSRLKSAGVKPSLQHSLLIEDFAKDWQKEWFTYRPDSWARSTHKLFSELWRAPTGATLGLQVSAAEPNKLVVLLDDFAGEVQLQGGGEWEEVELSPGDFQNIAGERLTGWDNVKCLRLSPAEHLRPKRGKAGPPKRIGGSWRGSPPEFRNLRWHPAP